jgi:hypothetical protein
MTADQTPPLCSCKETSPTPWGILKHQYIILAMSLLNANNASSEKKKFKLRNLLATNS